ncbi:MAG: cytochrome c biogenesis protein CcsA [bacterium]|nr:cytochrome c biogenesis protein CcsA [bacterium]
MTAQIPGQLAILFALACNVVAGLAFFMVARGQRSYERLASLGYHLFAIFTGVAVVWLYYLFFSHNYAFKYVYEYCDRSQPLEYIISGFWGGQEGTYLLWLFMNALFGYIIITRGGQYKYWAMTIFSVINLFFLFILVKLSPFALLPVAQPDGLGLNPLLRDPWMVIHPPIVFVGYAMSAVPFVIAMAALIINDYSGWLKRAFPWVAITALALAGGNILGGFWAYKTLGWGGFWAWDPVENSSFIPWVISLALLHGMIIERRSGALRKTNLLLASFVFLLVVYGTFLTRSGVLADFSVHSFTDLGINNLLIAFMVVSVLITLVIFLPRMRKVPSTPLNYSYFGREFSTFTGMAMLVLFGLVVLFWTSLPLLTNLVGAEPRAANPETYNGFALPLATIMAFLLTIAPFVQFSEFKLQNWSRKLLLVAGAAAVIGFGLFVAVLKADLLFAVIFTIVVTGVGLYLFKKELLKSLIPSLAVFAVTLGVSIALGVTDYLYLLFFATALMAATSNAIHLASFVPDRWKLMGGQLTHFGFGLMLVGILASAAFTSNQKIVIPKGESRDAYERSITYNGMENEITHPNNELKLLIAHNGDTKEARPQLYFSERMQGTMRRPYVDRTLTADYYMAPETIEEGNDQEALVIGKGESRRVGDMVITFKGYSMGQHGAETTGGMMVAAELEIAHDGTTSTASPAVEHSQDAAGETIRTQRPDSILFHGSTYPIHLDRIMADQGAVAIAIPGLIERSPEQLVLDVSKKPLINFVWIGAILIMLGSLITFLRRRDEMYSRQVAEQAQTETAVQPTRS